MVCSKAQRGKQQRHHHSSVLLALCAGNPPVTNGFPAKRASTMESVSISWRLHNKISKCCKQDCKNPVNHIQPECTLNIFVLFYPQAIVFWVFRRAIWSMKRVVISHQHVSYFHIHGWKQSISPEVHFGVSYIACWVAIKVLTGSVNECQDSQKWVRSLCQLWYIPWNVHTIGHVTHPGGHSLNCRQVTANHFNTSSPRQNGRHFADDISKCVFLYENVWISITISLKFIPKGPIKNIPALVQIMAWRRPGDKPLSESMMVRLPTYICFTQS